MNTLPVVPTPRRRKWREFRIQRLPGLVFCCTIALIGLIWGRSFPGPTPVGQTELATTSNSIISTNLIVQLSETVRPMVGKAVK